MVILVNANGINPRPHYLALGGELMGEDQNAHFNLSHLKNLVFEESGLWNAKKILISVLEKKMAP